MIDYKYIKKKLSEKIEDTGWDVVDRYIYSDSFQNILEHLVKDKENNRRFTPPVKYIFRAFEECKHNDVKVVMIGQDPYPNLNVADGLAFSCSLKMKEQPSLTKMFDYLEKKYDSFERDPDLKRWANQGILLLNTALTTQVNKIGSHYSLWEPFIKELISYINNNMSDIVFVFFGRKAEMFKVMVNQHPVFYAHHPASASYNKTNWNPDDVFNKINNKLKKFGKDCIVW